MVLLAFRGGFWWWDLRNAVAPGSWIFLRGGGKVGICTVLAFSSDTRVVGATCS